MNQLNLKKYKVIFKHFKLERKIFLILISKYKKRKKKQKRLSFMIFRLGF